MPHGSALNDARHRRPGRLIPSEAGSHAVPDSPRGGASRRRHHNTPRLSGGAGREEVPEASGGRAFIHKNARRPRQPLDHFSSDYLLPARMPKSNSSTGTCGRSAARRQCRPLVRMMAHSIAKSGVRAQLRWRRGFAALALLSGALIMTIRPPVRIRPRRMRQRTYRATVISFTSSDIRLSGII